MDSLCSVQRFRIATLCRVAHHTECVFHLEPFMFDLIFFALGVGLFFLAAAYVHFCDQL